MKRAWTWCRRHGRRCALAWLAGGLAAAALAAPPSGSLSGSLSVRDDRQKDVVFERPPERVVSLLPSLTESICALEACGRLVGVDAFSNWPEAVRGLPRLGGLEDTPIERVLALRPDVVFAAVGSRASARLEALGVPVVALEPRSLDDVGRVLRQVARTLGLPEARAQALWRRTLAEVDAAAQTLAPRLDRPPADGRHGGADGTVARPRVYFEIGSGPYAAGPDSFIGGLIVRLGADNIVPQSQGPYPRLNPEFVVRASPWRIIVAARQAGELPARPGWAALPALREGRVCAYADEAMDVLVRPGPRLGEAARLLADCLSGRMDARVRPPVAKGGR